MQELHIWNQRQIRRFRARILAWYSRETGRLQPLPGAEDPRYVQACGVWSPDGKSLLFLSTDGGTCQICAVDAEGTAVKQVTQGENGVEGFSFSKDGKTLTYTSMTALSLAELYIKDEEGKT